MKSQRDQVDMEMGPIMNISVDGDTATPVYRMYLTPKAAPDTTVDTIIAERRAEVLARRTPGPGPGPLRAVSVPDRPGRLGVR